MTTTAARPDAADVDAGAGAPGTLLQRVLLPQREDPAKVRTLYVDEADDRLHVADRSTGSLAAGGEVSFATYFNAFPAGYWRRWTALPTVLLRLELRGTGRVDVYRSKADGTAVHDRSQTVTDGGTLELELDLAPFIDGGWYWFDLTATDEDLTLVTAGWYATHAPEREGRLAVGICTYNRPADCVAAMSTIASDPVVSAELSAVVVADQGNRKVRDDAGFADTAAALGDRLRLVEQGNLGGSGGFARAMYETLEHTDATHLLFLDDDVRLEADSLHRALTFSRYTTAPLLVGGQMLHLQNRSVLHTMGEVVDRHSFLYRPAAHSQMQHDFAEDSLRETEELHRRIDVDYNAWWMCLIPREVPEKIGLPLPLFIKWDDAEYGLRAKAAGYPTVTLPGAAIWHLAWTDKDDVSDWQAYFFARNRLIAAALHSPHEDGGGIPTSAVKADMLHLLKLEYSAVALHLKAYEDFLAGPSGVFAALPTALADVRALQASYADSKVITSDIPEPELDAVVVEGLARPLKGRKAIPKRILRTLRALRASQRPVRASSDRPQVQVPAQDAAWYVLAGMDSVTVGTADGNGVTFRRRNPTEARQLLRRSIELNREIKRRFPELSAEYRAAATSLTSKEAWRTAFGLPPGN
jgi:galactofuranosylgalactofuranosylrhamnosyl-N-acetylglucosaminyl-diphospho-decaprenol beta-1,5/1,6-galactofuranosyltransferase